MITEIAQVEVLPGKSSEFLAAVNIAVARV